MTHYLIDENLPIWFSLWNQLNFTHVLSLVEAGEKWADSRVWNYAVLHGCTIVTKDADFSDWLLLSIPPPRVIHLRIGNASTKRLYEVLVPRWQAIAELSEQCKLVFVYPDFIEGIE